MATSQIVIVLLAVSGFVSLGKLAIDALERLLKGGHHEGT